MLRPMLYLNSFYSLTLHTTVFSLFCLCVHPSLADESVDSLGYPVPLLGGETVDQTGLDDLLFGNPDGDALALCLPDLPVSQVPENTSRSPEKTDSQPAHHLAKAESKTKQTTSTATRPSLELESAVVEPPKPRLKPLTQYEQNLKSYVRRVTAFYRRPRLNTRDHCPWEILHDVIANGTDTQVLMDGPNGKPVTAIGWLCFNRPAHGQQLLYPRKNRLGIKEGPGVQGHNGQFLAALAQARVMKTYPVRVAGKEFTVEDIIHSEQKACRSGTELTFKLIGLNHYLEPDATWTNELGETWSIERLVREELPQKINGATCGGTHRLVGLSLVVQKRQKLDMPINGVYDQASRKVHGYQRHTFQLQNSDGSFSSEWFRGPGNNPNLERRLRTSGHLLEWLVMTLPTDELRHPQMQRGVAYISNLLWQQRHRKWDAGYLCHPIHALNLYDQYIYRRIEQQDQPAAVADGRHAEPAR